MTRTISLFVLILSLIFSLGFGFAQTIDIDIGSPSASTPRVGNISTSATLDSATITWLTDKPADSEVEYGTTIGYGFLSNLDPALINNHNIVITNLQPSTLYHFRVRSADEFGFFYESSDNTFTTSSVQIPDTVAPYVSINLLDNSTINGSIIIDLFANDNVAISYIELYKDGAFFLNDTSAPYQYMLNTLNDPNGLHTLSARAFDTSNNQGFSSTINIFINNSANSSAPPTVSDVSVTLTTDSATITWLTDRSADSQIEYGLDTNYGLFTQLDSILTISHTVLVPGLQQSTTYHYRIRSADAFGLQPSVDHVFTTITSLSSTSGGGLSSTPVLPETKKPVSTSPVDAIKLTYDLQPNIPTRLGIPENFPIKILSIQGSQSSSAIIEVKKINSPNIPEPSAKVYSYVRIDLNIPVTNLSAEIEFDVPVEWVESNGFVPDQIKLLRYSEVWERLNTNYIGSTSTNYQFRAVTPGFSVFAVVGDTYQTTNQEEIIIPPIISAESKYSVPFQYFIISAVMFIIAILLYLYYRRKRKSKYEKILNQIHANMS